jgi:hypothetical protein
MFTQESNGSALTEGGINRVKLLEKIKGLHADVDGSVLECWQKNLPKMIQLGADLTALKKDVGYGAWLEWFRANAPYLGFSEDTAENYMRLYKRRDRLANSENVRNLTDALLLIKEPDPVKRLALIPGSRRNRRKYTEKSVSSQSPKAYQEGT